MLQRFVFCVALSRGRAGRILLDLKAAKFSSTEISALFLGWSAPLRRAEASDRYHLVSEIPIQSADIICGVMAWIAAVACYVVPGVDPVIVAGPIATLLSEGSVNGVADGLIDLGLSRVEARLYEERIKNGHVLVSVDAESSERSDRARVIFSAAGAEDIQTMTRNPAVKSATDSAQRTAKATVR